VPRLLSSLAVLGVLAPAVVALPVATPRADAPHPVRPAVTHLALGPAATDLPGPALRRADDGLAPTGTRSFSMVGVTWRHDPAVGTVAVQVRWRSGRAWSDWHRLGGDSDDAPDPRTGDSGPARRDGTAPLWVGHADGVQVRTTSSGVSPRDLRVELVDPGTSPADAAVGTVPRDSAAASENQPSILTRADWGADESIRRGSPSYSSTVKVGFVHHTDTANDYTMAQTPSVIRSIYAYHVQSNGWNDIGYNFLVDRFGRIWEGRYGGVTRAVVGAHTGGFNTDSFGTSLIGTFATVAPPAATLTALEHLFAWKLGASYRDPLGRATLISAGGGYGPDPAGAPHTFQVISGHRDASYTSCPGDAAYARLGSIRTAVASYLGSAFTNPSVSSTRVPVGSTTPVTVTAGVRNAPAWTLAITTPAGATVRSWSGSAGQSVSASWDLTDASGAAVPVGPYLLTLSGQSAGGDSALPWSTTVVVGSPQVPKGAWMSPRHYSTRFAPRPSPSP